MIKLTVSDKLHLIDLLSSTAALTQMLFLKNKSNRNQSVCRKINVTLIILSLDDDCQSHYI